MTWIESHTTLARHPKVEALARALGVSVPCAIGHLHLLWWWAIEYAPDGDLSAKRPAELAAVCLWTGQPRRLVAALAKCRLLDVDGGTKRIHDWEEYAQKLLQTRRKNAEYQRAWRRRQQAGTAPPQEETAPPREAYVSPTRALRKGIPTNLPTLSSPPPPSSPPDKDTPSLRSGVRGAVPATDAPTRRDADHPTATTPTSHPAVAAYRRITGRAPRPAVRRLIARGTEMTAVVRQLAGLATPGTGLERWEMVCTEWLARGHNPANVAGMLEWFRDSIPAPTKPTRRQATARPRTAIDAIADELRAIQAAEGAARDQHAPGAAAAEPVDVPARAWPPAQQLSQHARGDQR